MSAFAVFGVSRQLCLIKAKKAVSSKNLTYEEWLKESELKAEAIYKQGRKVILSWRYDAPQFCDEFIKACDKDNYKDLEVRVLSIIGTTKNGEEKISWERYEREESSSLLPQ
ncbi:hypothetical protein [Sinobacterium caligoides]|uniref:hypothetical protein n=1 Tax=Sinobacterium caligoides TaxID=933926 RepID=UPI000F4B7221|nr:hypothetical protein [Sinobacterium caligoides]